LSFVAALQVDLGKPGAPLVKGKRHVGGGAQEEEVTQEASSFTRGRLRLMSVRDDIVDPKQQKR
jgi:hypothetical protein